MSNKLSNMVKFSFEGEPCFPSGWISVDECLPVDKWECASDRILICIERGRNPVTQEITIGHYDYFRAHWRLAWGPVNDGKVTHWRPLPEPPQR